MKCLSLPKNSGACIDSTLTGLVEIVLKECTTDGGIEIKSPALTKCFFEPTVKMPSPSKKHKVSVWSL
jgi:hypothetical protein|tara:strand:+ start:1063 stop:1266 length:204 start_codon:yes stop_codon:yes gene_type:complete